MQRLALALATLLGYVFGSCLVVLLMYFNSPTAGFYVVILAPLCLMLALAFAVCLDRRRLKARMIYDESFISSLFDSSAEASSVEEDTER